MKIPWMFSVVDAPEASSDNEEEPTSGVQLQPVVEMKRNCLLQGMSQGMQDQEEGGARCQQGYLWEGSLITPN